MLRRTGSSWGFSALLKGISVVVLRVERVLYIHSAHRQSLLAQDSNPQPLGFLIHRNINRGENKAQIPLIILHNEKNQRIYLWCAAKDNWASQISEVYLRTEQEQWKFPFPPSGKLLRNYNQHKMLRNCLEEDVCLYRPNARWGGEFEWLFKDHSWRIAEYSWVSGSENICKKLSNSTYITTCCLGGFQEKWSSLIQK